MRCELMFLLRAVDVNPLIAMHVNHQGTHIDSRLPARLKTARVKIISYKRLRATASSELERYVDAFDMFEKRVENRRKFRHVPLTYRLRRHIVSSHAKRQ